MMFMFVHSPGYGGDSLVRGRNDKVGSSGAAGFEILVVHSLQQLCLGRPGPPRALLSCGTGRRGTQAARIVRVSGKKGEVSCVLL